MKPYLMKELNVIWLTGDNINKLNELKKKPIKYNQWMIRQVGLRKLWER